MIEYMDLLEEVVDMVAERSKKQKQRAMFHSRRESKGLSVKQQVTLRLSPQMH